MGCDHLGCFFYKFPTPPISILYSSFGDVIWHVTAANKHGLILDEWRASETNEFDCFPKLFSQWNHFCSK